MFNKERKLSFAFRDQKHRGVEEDEIEEKSRLMTSTFSSFHLHIADQGGRKKLQGTRSHTENVHQIAHGELTEPISRGSVEQGALDRGLSIVQCVFIDEIRGHVDHLITGDQIGRQGSKTKGISRRWRKIES